MADDGLAAATARAQEFVSGNGRNLAIGLGVLVVVAVGFFVVRGSAGSSERAASGLLAEARSAFTQGQVEQAAGTLTTILGQYGGTESAVKAHLLMGDVELRRGNMAAAETQFREASSRTDDSSHLWFNARRGLAVALENQSKFAEAATTYESLVNAPIGDAEKARALLDAARAHNLAGNAAGAVAACDRIVAEYGATPAVAAAKLMKAEAERTGGP